MEEMRIAVVDNFLNQADLIEIHQNIKRLHWNPFETDFYKGERVMSGMIADMSETLRRDIDNRVLRQAKELEDNDYSIFRAYINAWKCDDVSLPHTDQNHTTCVIYLNRDYNVSYGGETLFYDDDEDVVHAISPKAGRAVFFDGWLLHKAGSFNRRYQHDYRYTMAYKLTVDGDMEKAKNLRGE